MPPSEKGIVVWKKNYFRCTVNIYEPRGPKYQCSECDEIFNTRLSILTHSKMHLKPFCVLCGIYTQDMQEMQNHMKCDHRSMVEIILTKNADVDVNQNRTTSCSVERKEPIPSNKEKVHLTKRIAFGFKGQTKKDKHSTKCVISRFGRCINIKLPDF